MKKKILVIDDSYFDQLILNEIIESAWPEMQVDAVDSAEEGLRYLTEKADLENELPDLIFLDIKMPTLDGFGFLERFHLLSSPIKNKSTLYMLSSSIDPEDIKRAKQSPYVKDFLEKPISDEFVDRLGRE